MNHINLIKSSNSILDAVSFITTKHKKPKRNRSAFILFSIDARHKSHLGQNISELNPNDRLVRIAQLWKEARPEERQVYEQKAKQEKLQYTSKLSDFCQLFPATIISKSRNKTKRPCNAYGYFLKDVKDSIRSQNPGIGMCEVIKIIAERWKTLDPSKKIIYEARAKENQKTYHSEMKKQMTTVKAKKIKLNSGLEACNNKENKQENLMRNENEDLVLEDDAIYPKEISVKNEEDPTKNCVPAKIEDLVQQPGFPMIGFQQYQNQPLEASKSALLNLYNKVESLRQMIINQIDRFPVSELSNGSDSTASHDLGDLKSEYF